MTRSRLVRAILLSWLLAAAILLAIGAADVARLRFLDPDDAMRLLEVRDWLGGQSWWDVGQHRLNGGDFPMHWSRLVDLPLAATMALLDPLLGQGTSTRVAMALVPLLTLLAVMALVAAITRRLAGVAVARLALLLVPLSVPIVFQVRPMRIDHHGWQITLALAAALALLGPPTKARGAAAGLALAALLTISLEGMPIAAAIAGIAALAWALEPRRAGLLAAFGTTLACAALLLQLATRGAGWTAPACDAMAPVWLGVLAIGGIGVALFTRLPLRTPLARIAALALVGGAATAIVPLAAPICLRGPFATLPPLVYRLWYLGVSEGRPLWEQAPVWAAMTVGLPIVGLAGSGAAVRATTGRRRARWTILLALLAAATATAVFVNRAGGTANALAVPGAAAMLHALLSRARRVPNPLLRTVATAGALLAATPGLAAAMVFLLVVPRPDPSQRASDERRLPCARFEEARVLGRLGAVTVFAPIDIGPELIATTRLHAVAGGYHRGATAMEKVMLGFTAPPDRAHAVVAATGASYVVACPGLNEVALYRAIAPQGLWARLERGERIAWLRPVPMPGRVLAWRVMSSPRREPSGA